MTIHNYLNKAMLACLPVFDSTVTAMESGGYFNTFLTGVFL